MVVINNAELGRCINILRKSISNGKRAKTKVIGSRNDIIDALYL